MRNICFTLSLLLFYTVKGALCTSYESINTDLIRLNKSDTRSSITYVLNEVPTLDGSLVIQPQFAEEAHLFNPIPQVSFEYTSPQPVLSLNEQISCHSFERCPQIFSSLQLLYKEQNCSNSVIDDNASYSISVCQNARNDNVSLITLSNIYDSVTIQKFTTSFQEIERVKQLKLMNNFLVILTSNNSSNADVNSLHIYRINFESTTPIDPIISELTVINGSIFHTDNLNITGFDLSRLFGGIFKVFMTDRNYGVRVVDIDANTGNIVRYSSSPANRNPKALIIKNCETLDYCDIILSLGKSFVLFVTWTEEEDTGLLTKISTFEVSKSFNVKQLAISKNFLVVAAQELDEQESLLFYFIDYKANGELATSIHPFGILDCEPLALQAWDYTLSCDSGKRNESECEMMLGNVTGFYHFYRLKPYYSIEITTANLTSSYVTLQLKNTIWRVEIDQGKYKAHHLLLFLILAGSLVIFVFESIKSIKLSLKNNEDKEIKMI